MGHVDYVDFRLNVDLSTAVSTVLAEEPLLSSVETGAMTESSFQPWRSPFGELCNKMLRLQAYSGPWVSASFDPARSNGRYTQEHCQSCRSPWSLAGLAMGKSNFADWLAFAILSADPQECLSHVSMLQ